jgi:hypothetical protein
LRRFGRTGGVAWDDAGSGAGGESAHHLSGTMEHADLNPAHRRWLNRLADAVDDYELFPDMRRLGEILPAIIADAAGKMRAVEAHLSPCPTLSQQEEAAPIAA